MDYIYHHGIKGQRWGVRRTPAQLGHKPEGGKQKPESHEDYNKAHSKKSVKSMSDAELRTRLNRLNMEQQYKKMNPSSVQRGKKLLLGTVAVLGTTVAAINNAEALYGKYKKYKDALSGR